MDPATLTFTTGNWNAAQTVSVTPVDDGAGDGTQVTTIRLTVNGATADTTGYAALDPPDVSMTVLDDDALGFTVDPISGLSTSEGLASDSFTVALDSAPDGDVW